MKGICTNLPRKAASPTSLQESSLNGPKRMSHTCQATNGPSSPRCLDVVVCHAAAVQNDVGEVVVAVHAHDVLGDLELLAVKASVVLRRAALRATEDYSTTTECIKKPRSTSYTAPPKSGLHP